MSEFQAGRFWIADPAAHFPASTRSGEQILALHVGITGGDQVTARK
jgi:hypothetical protein